MSESEINIGSSNKDSIRQKEKTNINDDNTIEQEINIGLNQNENTEEFDKEDSNIDKEEDISDSKDKTEDNWPNDNQKINSKYNVEENAEKINEMVKRTGHFLFGLMFFALGAFSPLFFIFALGSLTMAVADNKIVNDVLNSNSSIIKIFSRVSMLPELLISGTKRAITSDDHSMLTGLITGDKINYNQNKGIIYECIKDDLKAKKDNLGNHNKKYNKEKKEKPSKDLNFGINNKIENIKPNNIKETLTKEPQFQENTLQDNICNKNLSDATINKDNDEILSKTSNNLDNATKDIEQNNKNKSHNFGII